MHIEKLVIQGIRNLEPMECQLAPGANIFFGRNGSGKTSILEAAFILSRGRSFRTRNLRSVINHQHSECTLFAQIDTGREGGQKVPMGVTRSADGKFLFKINGEQATSASQLTESLPVLLLNSESYLLLEGAPSHRRSYLDWGVFHVEQGFRHAWGRYQRGLKHRNTLLRRDRIDALQLRVWDRELSALAETITRAREEFLAELEPEVRLVLEQLAVKEESYQLRFLPGWDRRKSLEESFAESLARDRKDGYTHVGPHRADLRIYCGDKLAVETLSRGQAKALVMALKIAQGRIFQSLTGNRCIYLLDDLPAELDRQHRCSVAKVLMEMGVQALITGVDKESLTSPWLAMDGVSGPECRVFHVEQGSVTAQV